VATQVVAHKFVHPLSVVPSVGQYRIDADRFRDTGQQASGVLDIGPRAAFGHHRKDHVAGAITDHAGLGEAGVRRGLIERITPCFIGVLATLTAFDKVATDVA